ncbi:MAG: glycosyltransferase [Thermofilum sp.]
MEHAVRSLAERLARRGHDVVVLAGEPRIDRPAEEEVDGVAVVRWPTWSPGGAYHVPRRPRAFAEAVRELARGRDVVHIHSAHAVIAAMAGRAVLGLAKVVFSPHYHGGGHTALRSFLWRAAWRRYVESLIEGAEAIHAVSPVEAELLARDFPSIRGKLRVLPNGVNEDTERYKWTGQGSDYAVFAGRLERYKRVREAAELARRLGLKLVALGDGPCARELRRSGAEVRGFAPREEYLAALAGARYAVNLSRREAFSIFIAEALRIGVPSIVSPQIARALGAQCEGYIEGYCVAARAEVRTWEELIGRYEELYDEASRR